MAEKAKGGRELRPGREQLASNVWHNIRKGRPQAAFHASQPTEIMLCAGGPSLLEHISDIRNKQLMGMAVVCVGNVGHTLMAHGVKVDGHILVDGTPRNKSFIVPTVDTRYFVASQCDPSVLDALHRHKYVYIWHAGLVADEKQDLDRLYGKWKWFQVLGGSYVTLRAISLMHLLGYRYIHIYGMDSCIMGNDDHHAYPQQDADGHKTREVTVSGRTFKAMYWMLDQATQFCESIIYRRFGDVELAVHGDGLIAHMIRTGSTPTWQLQAAPLPSLTRSRTNLAVVL